jgi:ABC-2 type transport system ATP-binding protein
MSSLPPIPSPSSPSEPLSPQTAAIFCQGLSKTYGPIVALKDLDLAVPFGSVFGFLGRNGAGKTTTMRLLTGLARPTAGRAWIAGRETTGNNRLARTQFGYLPQEPAFYSWMNAREYLNYVGQIQELPAPQRKKQIEELLILSGLKEASRRRIGGFSGGMVQRLGIAQALIGNPPVLLLDEPTSSLDPAGRFEVLEMISRIRGQATVLLSSHILNDIERVCDTLAVLHQGRLILVSGRDELMEKYPANAVELELEKSAPANGASSISNFLEALKSRPWVAGIHAEGSLCRVMVNNISEGKRDLLPLVMEHGLLLNRLEWVRPSLEEIFLQLSS